MSRRLELLTGKCTTPKQIVNLVNHQELDNMFQSLWHNYLMKSDATTSAAYWSDRFNDNQAFNNALIHLSKSGWIITNVIPGRNWGTVQLDSTKLLQWISAEELLAIRVEFKFSGYMMDLSEVKDETLTKTPLGKKNIGIERPGTNKSGKSEFRYDTKYLAMYRNEIILNTTKGIRAAAEKHHLVIDGADYKSVSEEIIDMHMYSPDKVMNMGQNWTDSRGRAISSSLSKVFNPIGYKDARALLVGPNTALGLAGFSQVYLAVAELLGHKPDTIEEKIELGRSACTHRDLHDLDLTKQSDRDELHENIWLMRIYDNLDIYNGHNWTVPIEIDATASVIQIQAALLNDYNMADETNILNSGELKDVWSKGMPRKQFKYASTPLLYGSTQDCTTLWKKKKIKYTAEHIAIHKEELAHGVLGLANDFKDFIIANVEPKPEMKVKIWNEEFVVNCNRYRNLGDYMKKYPIYNSATNTVLTINHTHTKRIPDLEQFRRYFITLLVHNLDSQGADRVTEQLNWSISIYDAFIVMPCEALPARKYYAEFIDDINADRTKILGNYFQSIGIPQSKGVAKHWDKVMSKTVQVESFKCELTALK